MNKIKALQKAKDMGFSKAIFMPYTYHPRTLDSHIKEAQNTASDPDYIGSAEESTIWKIKEEYGSTYINGSTGDHYLLML